MSDLQIGRAYPDTYRVAFSSSPAVNAIRPVVNGNQEALKALQETMMALELRVAALEQAATNDGEDEPSTIGKVS